MPETTRGKSRLLRSIVLIFGFLAVGSLLGGLLFAARQEPPRRAESALPPLVESIVVRTEDAIERFMGYGTAEATRVAHLAAEVGANIVGRVEDIRAGSVVAEGQELIRLDDREYRYALARAEARAAAERAGLAELDVEAYNLEQLIKMAEQELRVASAERARLADLFERKLAAKKEYDFANLAYQRARRVLQGYLREAAVIGPRRDRVAASQQAYEAEAALARLNIERCVIKAPFAGRIMSIGVDTGDRVGVGSVVLTLIDASRVEIPIQLPGAVYDRVKVGATCTIGSESMTTNVWRGDVARIAPAADEQTRTFAAYVVVDNTTQAQPLVPGTFVQAMVRGPVYPNRILVPRGAFRSGRVFVVEDGVARLRSVAVDGFIEDRAMVGSGVRDGDRVILSHLERLADGSPVRVRSEQPASAVARESTQQVDTGSSP